MHYRDHTLRIAGMLKTRLDLETNLIVLVLISKDLIAVSYTLTNLLLKGTDIYKIARYKDCYTL